MKNKKKKYNAIKSACKADREREIALYGKLVSMRPSRAHKSKKMYDRKKYKNNPNLDLE